eukprot:g9851.t1
MSCGEQLDVAYLIRLSFKKSSLIRNWSTPCSKEVKELFDSQMRWLVPRHPDWQLIYLGGTISSSVRLAQKEEWRLNDHLLSAQQVYQTHAFGFAADAAFVSWSRQNSEKCFLFQPQLLKQPGGENRWKDSDIFVEGTWFKKAYLNQGDESEYDFAKASALGLHLKIERKDDVDAERTFHREEDDKAEPSKPNRRPSSKQAEPAKSAGRPSSQQAARRHSSQQDDVDAERTFHREEDDKAEPSKPNRRPSSEQAEPAKSAGRPSSHQAEWAPGDNSEKARKALAAFQRHAEDDDFAQALPPEIKDELQRFLEMGSFQSFKASMELLVEGASSACRLHRAALRGAVSDAVEHGGIERVRTTVKCLSDESEASGWQSSLCEKLACTIRCFLEFHFGLPEQMACKLEAAVRHRPLAADDARQLEAIIGVGPRAALGIVTEATILPKLFNELKAAGRRFEVAEKAQAELLQILGQVPGASASSSSSSLNSPVGRQEESEARSASASPSEDCSPLGQGLIWRLVRKRLSRPAPVAAVDVDPADSGKEGEEGEEPPLKVPKSSRRGRCSTAMREETRSQGLRWCFLGGAELLPLSVRDLRAKAKTHGVPCAILVGCIEKADLVEVGSPAIRVFVSDGTDWQDYCKSFGSAKAKFLLEEKLPRAFAIGKELGIRFRLDRRIVHTVDVNTALLVAQEHGVAEEFAASTLAAHFEGLENPNDLKALTKRFEALNVAPEKLLEALKDPDKEGRICMITLLQMGLRQLC